MKVLLIIPAYNEAQNIDKTVQSIDRFIRDDKSEIGISYIVINDCSTDDTAELLKSQNIPHINLIRNLGIGGAVQTGYKYAFENNIDIAVQFDGDGQHDIDSLPNLLEPIISGGYNFCLGSRFVEGAFSDFKTSRIRRIGIQFISELIYITTRKRFFDVTSGYRAADREIIEYFSKRYPADYPEPETLVHLVKKRFTIIEKPVNMFEREAGASSIHSFKSLFYMIKVSIAVVVSSFMKEED